MDTLLNKLWRLNIICCAGIAITTVYEMSGITSLLFYVSFLITAACLLLCLQKRISGYSANTILLLMLLVAAGLFSVLQGGFRFAYLKKFIIYITTLSSFFVATKTRVSGRTVGVLLGSNLVVSLVYILRSRAAGAYIQQYLWLFFSNPNFAGMWLFMSAVLLVVTVVLVKKRFWRAILLVITGYLTYLSFQTGSRNIWFSIGYAAVLCVLCIIAKKSRFKKWQLFVVDMFPLLFVFAYMFVISKDLVTESVSDIIVSDGKTITSRFAIWRNAFEFIGKYPLFGAYSVIGGGSGSFQLHNTHVDMWAAYGTVGLVLFLVYIYRIMKEVNDSCNTKGAMFALAGFMCMTLMGTAEASLYATGMGMYIYVSSFLLLANYMNQRGKNEDRISLN